MHTRQCLFCIILIVRSQKLNAVSNKCIKIPLINFRQVAGILSVDMIDDPDFVKFQKPICISNTPSVSVNINNISLNLLNETLADEGCRDMYQKLLCTQTKKILPNRCREAHHVMFAIIQSLPECKIDKDCDTPYKVGGLECSWITDLQHAVCEDMTKVNFRCEKEKSKAVYIKNMCYLTNSTCHFIVTNMVVLSILAGLSWAFVTIFFIYFGQSWCDRVQNLENEANEAYRGVDFSGAHFS